MKKNFFTALLLMLMTVMNVGAQTNEHNMVITLKNGTTITLGHDDLQNITFNGETINVEGNTIDGIQLSIAKLQNDIQTVAEKVDQHDGRISTVEQKCANLEQNGVSKAYVDESIGWAMDGLRNELWDNIGALANDLFSRIEALEGALANADQRINDLEAALGSAYEQIQLIKDQLGMNAKGQ